jgi:hypothetical protein
LLIGDAAHSTGGSLGQGANSALQDVVALSRCLDAATTSSDLGLEVDIDRAIESFSEGQVKEGLALWQLLQLPPKGAPWAAIYQVMQLALGGLGRIPGVGSLIALVASLLIVLYNFRTEEVDPEAHADFALTDSHAVLGNSSQGIFG